MTTSPEFDEECNRIIDEYAAATTTLTAEHIGGCNLRCNESGHWLADEEEDEHLEKLIAASSLGAFDALMARSETTPRQAERILIRIAVDELLEALDANYTTEGQIVWLRDQAKRQQQIAGAPEP